jgi:hypothetical protein
MDIRVSGWSESSSKAHQTLKRDDLLRLFHGEVAGIRIPAFLSSEQCHLVVGRLQEVTQRRARQYRGPPGGLNIGTVLDIESHWEFMYVLENDAAWKNYFRKVAATTRLRRRLFAGVGDPVDRVAAMLAKAWGAPVGRLRKSGKQLYAGLIRSGVPQLHFDWAPFDIPEREVVMQAGLNIYLHNGRTGGDLKVYRTYGMTRGNTASSGSEVIGNYGLPHSLIEGVESRTIACRVGDLVVAPNRLLHEVTPTNIPHQQRLSLSFHVAWMNGGNLAVFS